jgi:rod shape-determining protein MreD
MIAPSRRPGRVRMLQERLRRRLDRRINFAPSPTLAAALPWASIVALSLLGSAAMVASAPLLPPLGFLALLGWRMLRPGMLPIWAGFPLGAADDLYSGQPFGSAILLWSCAMLAMEMVDKRLRWRGFPEDWAVAGVLIVAYLVAAAVLAGLAGAPVPLAAIIPQAIVSLLGYPLAAALVAVLDRVRLMPMRTPQ